MLANHIHHMHFVAKQFNNEMRVKNKEKTNYGCYCVTLGKSHSFLPDNDEIDA